MKRRKKAVSGLGALLGAAFMAACGTSEEQKDRFQIREEFNGTLLYREIPSEQEGALPAAVAEELRQFHEEVEKGKAVLPAFSTYREAWFYWLNWLSRRTLGTNDHFRNTYLTVLPAEEYDRLINGTFPCLTVKTVAPGYVYIDDPGLARQLGASGKDIRELVEADIQKRDHSDLTIFEGMTFHELGHRRFMERQKNVSLPNVEAKLDHLERGGEFDELVMSLFRVDYLYREVSPELAARVLYRDLVRYNPFTQRDWVYSLHGAPSTALLILFSSLPATGTMVNDLERAVFWDDSGEVLPARLFAQRAEDYFPRVLEEAEFTQKVLDLYFSVAEKVGEQLALSLGPEVGAAMREYLACSIKYVISRLQPQYTAPELNCRTQLQRILDLREGKPLPSDSSE